MGNRESFQTVSRIPSRRKVKEFHDKHPDSGILVDINYGFITFTGDKNLANVDIIEKMIKNLRFNGYPFLPNATFILFTGDSDYPNWRNTIGKGIWLNSTHFPDEAILHPAWYFVTKDNKKILKRTNWKNKMNKIIWRGSTTGKCKPDYEKNDDPSRRILVDFSKRFPNVIDAKFTNFTDNELSVLENEYSKGEHMIPTDQQNYKYIFNIDGNGASYGLYWQLNSGSHVFRWSTHKQWFDPYFKGTMTEITYPEDLERFTKNMNENKAKRRAMVAYNTSERVFTDQFVYDYLYNTIKRYSKEQNRNSN